MQTYAKIINNQITETRVLTAEEAANGQRKGIDWRPVNPRPAPPEYNPLTQRLTRTTTINADAVEQGWLVETMSHADQCAAIRNERIRRITAQYDQWTLMRAVFLAFAGDRTELDPMLNDYAQLEAELPYPAEPEA